MNDDKAKAAWHPGDGPVKPTDLDALVADLLAQSARALNGTVPEDAARFSQDIPDLLRIVLAALAAETARADAALVALNNHRCDEADERAYQRTVRSEAWADQARRERDDWRDRAAETADPTTGQEAAT